MNYLQIVNRAILESGADLEQMTSGDFSSPTDSMQTKFKNWAASAWRELQQEINDWQFQSKQAQIVIYPRFLVVDGDSAAGVSAGDVFTGQGGGASFEVVSVDLLSGAWATGTAVAWIDYTELDGNIKWSELYDETSPTPDTNVFELKWWGRYNLQSEVTDLLEPDTSSFFIQTLPNSTAAPSQGDEEQNNRPLQYMPWAQFKLAYEGDQVSTGDPQVVTCTPDGFYDFWPRPDEPFLLTFTYTAEPQELSAHGDEPSALPSNYHEILVWATVMKWADYQERPAQFIRAERYYEKYRNRLELNQRPRWSFGPNIYDQPSY